ncbi:hypothetical protein PFICI_00060 [Pestalotiopsis fici W106-1]|uniref:DUF7580 domain-containing protein n=1 Tax=Pestalotiopsis fici (strain W106-1 / CGMCC3.15140) TaxID=1229662 RepID=W3XLA5_PESFW|nr:uncharacterized protein PFICI_00060 [Pestalotiopsis fici W106-1]ETS86232.1 hypothetical protein PFICI_00060 [Pestalotiopsis fici W106-1]
MSGFEVAGIVLGVLPLAINTINSYRTTLSSIKTAQNDLNWLRRDLETEQVRLQNTCELLLHDLVPLSMVDTMLKDPFGADWAKYDDKLRERLWLSWGTFQAQVQLLSTAATELEKKLCVERNGAIRLNDYKKILRELRHKTSFTLKKGDYEALLSKIKSSNTVLHGLAQQDINMKSNRQHRSQARVIKLLRGLSESIFNAMRSAVTCDCADAHKIGIELATRHAVLLPDDEEEEVAAKFLYNVAIDSVKAPTEWNRAKLQLDKSTPVPEIIAALPDPVFMAPEKKRKKVAWRAVISSFESQPQTVPVQIQMKTSETISTLRVDSPCQSQATSLISNLCKVFHGKRKALSQSESYGHISTGQRCFRLSPPVEEPSKFSHTVTLRDILSGLTGLSEKTIVPFGYEERLQLALTLSNSVLHTYNTPWLAKMLTLDDISFLWGAEAQIHQEWWKNPYRPFVTQAIPLSSWEASFIRVVDCPRMINTTILSLGALLVQIITGSVEESLELPTTMKMEDFYARRESASRLEAKVIENGGPNYAEAVSWCFDHAIGPSGFQNEKFCQEFYEVVIAKLEEDAALLEEQSRL